MPDCVYQMGNLRIVDLTKVLDPKTESRRCHLIRYNTGGPIPDFHTALDLTSHLGTHCECPYHHFEDGKSVGDLPLTTFMGRAIYVNIDFLEPNSHISAADLDRACGDRIQEGDIVILDSNWKFPPFTPETNSPADKRLFINAETAIWMRDHKVKCVGFGDGVSIENCEADVKPFHDIIMAYDGVFLEVLIEVVDARGQQSDLHLRGASVALVTGIFLDDCFLRRLIHDKNPPNNMMCQSPPA